MRGIKIIAQKIQTISDNFTSDKIARFHKCAFKGMVRSNQAILEYTTLAHIRSLAPYHRDTALVLFYVVLRNIDLRNGWLQVSLYIACNAVLEKAFASYGG